MLAREKPNSFECEEIFEREDILSARLSKLGYEEAQVEQIISGCYLSAAVLINHNEFFKKYFTLKELTSIAKRKNGCHHLLSIYEILKNCLSTNSNTFNIGQMVEIIKKGLDVNLSALIFYSRELLKFDFNTQQILMLATREDGFSCLEIAYLAKFYFEFKYNSHYLISKLTQPNIEARNDLINEIKGKNASHFSSSIRKNHSKIQKRQQISLLENDLKKIISGEEHFDTPSPDTTEKVITGKRLHKKIGNTSCVKRGKEKKPKKRKKIDKKKKKELILYKTIAEFITAIPSEEQCTLNFGFPARSKTQRLINLSQESTGISFLKIRKYYYKVTIYTNKLKKWAADLKAAMQQGIPQSEQTINTLITILFLVQTKPDREKCIMSFNFRCKGEIYNILNLHQDETGISLKETNIQDVYVADIQIGRCNDWLKVHRIQPITKTTSSTSTEERISNPSSDNNVIVISPSPIDSTITHYNSSHTFFSFKAPIDSLIQPANLTSGTSEEKLLPSLEEEFDGIKGILEAIAETSSFHSNTYS